MPLAMQGICPWVISQRLCWVLGACTYSTHAECSTGKSESDSLYQALVLL